MAEETAAKSETAGEDRLGWGVLHFDYLRKPHDWVASVVYAFVFFLLCGFVYFALVILYRVVSLATSGAALEINQLLLALAGIIGAPFVVWRVLIAAKANSIAEASAAEKARIDIQNLQSTLLTKAVEQLGAMREEKKTEIGEKDGVKTAVTDANTVPNTEVRLGAIYALEKLLRDSEELHWPIMEILCAYVRNNAKEARPRTKAVATAYAVDSKERNEVQQKLIADHEANNLKPLFVDVQAALTVIGRRPESRRDFEARSRNVAKDGQEYRLDLSGCHLATAKLDGLHLQEADFTASCLEGASLRLAHLEGASLLLAHLEGAMLPNAHLDGASLNYAHLEYAFLYQAHLEGATLDDAHLEDAFLNQAHLEGATLNDVHIERASLDDGHLEGASLRKAHLKGASLNRAHLEGASLDGAHLEGATMHQAYLTDTSLNGAICTATSGIMVGKIAKAWGDQATILPESVQRPVNDRWLTGAGSDERRRARNAAWTARRDYWLAEAAKRRAENK